MGAKLYSIMSLLMNNDPSIAYLPFCRGVSGVLYLLSYNNSKQLKYHFKDYFSKSCYMQVNRKLHLPPLPLWKRATCVVAPYSSSPVHHTNSLLVALLKVRNHSS